MTYPKYAQVEKPFDYCGHTVEIYWWESNERQWFASYKIFYQDEQVLSASVSSPAASRDEAIQLAVDIAKGQVDAMG